MGAQQEKIKGIFIGSDHDGISKPRLIGLLIAIVLLLGALSIGISHLVGNNSSLSPAQQQAVSSTDDKYQAFSGSNDVMYNRSRLNDAVVAASQKKCDQASAIYDAVAKSDSDKSELTRYKTRIDALCSGKPATAAQE